MTGANYSIRENLTEMDSLVGGAVGIYSRMKIWTCSSLLIIDKANATEPFQRVFDSNASKSSARATEPSNCASEPSSLRCRFGSFLIFH